MAWCTAAAMRKWRNLNNRKKSGERTVTYNTALDGFLSFLFEQILSAHYLSFLFFASIIVLDRGCVISDDGCCSTFYLVGLKMTTGHWLDHQSKEREMMVICFSLSLAVIVRKLIDHNSYRRMECRPESMFRWTSRAFWMARGARIPARTRTTPPCPVGHSPEWRWRWRATESPDNRNWTLQKNRKRKRFRDH